MCDSPAVRAALKRAGRPCYEDLPEEVRRQIDAQSFMVGNEPEPQQQVQRFVEEDEAAAAAETGW
jgi:hypothetical protein